MKKMNKKNFAAAAALTLCLLAGCGAPSTVLSQPESKAAGALLLSVNPEIELEYDQAGLVLEAKGLNEDGKAVLEGLGELQGQNCGAALNQLVCEIYENGYFEKTVDGHPKNIVLKLKEGSVYPDDDFLEDLAQKVRDSAHSCGIASQTVTVGENELNESGCIGQEKAKEIVLAQLGLETAEFREQKYDPEDGEYEFEFIANGMEYEFDVDARTGKVMEADAEPENDFLEDIASQTVTVGKTELNKSDCIGQEKAKEIVLAQLGLKNAEFHEQKYDPEDGEYEFEFVANGMEYEFDVDARTGKVTKADAEPNDDGKWDAPDDDRDDPDDHETDNTNEQEHDFD